VAQHGNLRILMVDAVASWVSRQKLNVQPLVVLRVARMFKRLSRDNAERGEYTIYPTC